MRARNAMFLFLGLGLMTACTENTIDDPDSADVILEVASTTITPVSTTGAISTGDCVMVVTPWSATLNNKPKSSGAITSPFNDILLGHLTISYEWDDPSIVTAPTTVNIAGTVPANGSLTLQFTPILLGDLSPVMQGHSANTTLLFEGVTVSGEDVSATALGGVLNVATCAP